MLAKLVTTSTVQTQLVDSTVTLSILVVTTVNLALKWLTSRRLRPMGGCLARLCISHALIIQSDHQSQAGKILTHTVPVMHIVLRKP